MLSELIKDGKIYVPATEAGKQFEYTKDYILLLIKEGKIDGQKVGHKWYVNLASAQEFFDTAKRERDVRRKKISQTRKEELKQHTEVRTVNYQRMAVVETLVIVVIGLTVGVTGYLGTATQTASLGSSEFNFLERFAISFYELISPRERERSVFERQIPTSLDDSLVGMHVGTSTVTSFVVAPDEVFTTSTVEAIQDSFSDPVSVSVDSENPNTGIITPEFKTTKGEPYRFLMVPVTPKP